MRGRGLIWGIERAVRRDRTLLDKRLRRYGGRAYQLTDDEQKQAASVQVTQMLAKRVEAATATGGTPIHPAFASPDPTESARYHQAGEPLTASSSTRRSPQSTGRRLSGSTRLKSKSSPPW